MIRYEYQPKIRPAQNRVQGACHPGMVMAPDRAADAPTATAIAARTRGLGISQVTAQKRNLPSGEWCTYLQMKKLYRFHADFGRMGDLTGIFVEDEEKIAKLTGTRVHFGEVLGKHSDIALVIKADHFEALTDDQTFIEKFEGLRCQSGTNPLRYLEEEL